MKIRDKDLRLNNKTSVYLYFLIFFVFTACVVYFPFLYFHKSFVWISTSGDGLYQHFNGFIYIGKYFREIISNLVHHHRLTIPMWDFAIGYGGDIITTLTYYVLGDPFALCSILIPTAYAEYGYGLLIVARVFFAGLAFCAYCRRMDCPKFGTVCGALAYCFCGFVLISAVRHPYFTNPMIWLPMIWLGIEKIIDRERPFLYTISVFMACISNFYFFYMIVIFTALYVLVRGLEATDRNFREFLKLTGHILCYSIIGVLMAAVLFLPSAMAFLDCSRGIKSYTFSPLYRWRDYMAFPAAFLSMTVPVYWAQISITPIGIAVIIVDYLNGKRSKWPRITMIIYTVFLLFPVFGYILNGFGYVSNRWTFAYALVQCFMFARSAEDIFNLPKKKKMILSVCCFFYFFLLLLIRSSRNERTMASLIVLLFAVLAILEIDRIQGVLWRRGYRISRLRLGQAFILSLTILGIVVNSFYRYANSEMNYVSEFVDRGTALELLEGDDTKAANLIQDERFYRIDTGNVTELNRNYALHQGRSSTVLYWSIIPKRLTEFLIENMAYSFMIDYYRGQQSRSMLLPLASIKYFVTPTEENYQRPYRFHKVEDTETQDGLPLTLYKSNYALPLGYTYDQYITEEEYLKLTVEQRQQAMLQAAVIPEELETRSLGIPEADPTYTDMELSYETDLEKMEALGDKAVEINGHTIIARSQDAKLVLATDCPKRVELYAHFRGLEFETRPMEELMKEEDLERLSPYDRKIMKLQERYEEEITASYLSAQSNNGISTTIGCYTDRNIYAHGRKEYLFNLYYSKKARNTVTITFSQPGIYTYDSLSLVAQPMTGFEKSVLKLREDHLRNVKLETNCVKGDIRLAKKKVLCLSIPYSDGWSLTVDGSPTELYSINRMYMGTALPAGEHHIELHYKTPYLKLGFLISACGFALFILKAQFIGKHKNKVHN